MSKTKNIDDLVTLLRSKRAELTALGNEIESSASETVVAFVDLSSSTELKNEVEPQEWLGYVHEFLLSIAQLTKEAGGVVVKRIGDELMLTFKTTAMCETFLDMIMQKELLNRYTFKIGVDFGSAFHFKFAEHLESDPYGQVVDRCARIAKLAGAGSIVVSCFYRDALDQPSKYVEVGEFHLKGIPTPVQVFLRPLQGDVSNEYIQPLIDALNDKGLAIGGYHFTYKKFPTHYFRALPKSEARPFLLRELLNAPHLPISAGELSTVLNEKKDTDKESQYIGYLVEWEGEFESFQRSDEKITVNLNIAGSKGLFFRCTLCLVPDMLEIVRMMKSGDIVKFRGIITRIFLSFSMNYVQILSVTSKA